MNRRQLLTRFAAIAAAVTVAPAVETVQAAPGGLKILPLGSVGTRTNELHAGEFHARTSGGVFVGGEQGWGHYTYIREPQVVLPQPLTFEAMQVDCAARGCVLDAFNLPQGGSVFKHQDGDWDNYPISLPFVGSVALDLARVDAWRRGLHDLA